MLPHHGPAGFPDGRHQPLEGVPGRFFKRYPAGFYRLPFLVGLVPEGIAGMRTGKAPSLFSAFPRHAHQPPFLFPRGLPSFFRHEKMALLLFPNPQETEVLIRMWDVQTVSV